MTLKSKIGLAVAVALAVLVAAVALIDRKRDIGPPAAVSFLRYEENGRAAILQITNFGSSPVFYSSEAYFSNVASAWSSGRKFNLISCSVFGDTAIGLQAHQVLELRVPMKLLANSDAAPSSVTVGYWLPVSPLQKRLGRLLRPLGFDAKPKRFMTSFDLAFPAATNALSKGPLETR